MEPLNIPYGNLAIGPGPFSKTLFDRPGRGDEKLLEQPNRVAIGHPGEKVAGGGVEALRLDRSTVEKLFRSLAHLLPEAAENVGRLLKLRRRGGVFVYRAKEKGAELEDGTQ